MAAIVLGVVVFASPGAGFAASGESSDPRATTYQEGDFRRDRSLAAQLRDTMLLRLEPVRSAPGLRSHLVRYRLDAGAYKVCLDEGRYLVRLRFDSASGRNLLLLDRSGLGRSANRAERICKFVEVTEPGVHALQVVHDGRLIGKRARAAFLHLATRQSPRLVNGNGQPSGGFWALRPDPAADPKHRLGRLAPASPWRPTGSLNTPRSSFTATVLAGGKVLAAGGDVPPRGTAEIYDPDAGAWTYTGSMTEPRSAHTATPLNGKVFAAGGHVPAGDSATTELYDPATGAWTARASMNRARRNHAAVLLPSGKVLVAGGLDGAASLSSAELYDPVADRWTATGDMISARFGHTLTLVPSGKVLAVGQNVQNPNQPAAEIYDPATGIWTATGPMSAGRYAHTATLLSSGKVLVAGGRIETAARVQSCTASVEQFDPDSGAWSTAGAGRLAIARAYHTATMLPSGGLVVAGGDSDCDSRNFTPIAADEIHDPDGFAWIPFGTAGVARAFHQTVFVPVPGSSPDYGKGPLLDIGGSEAGMQALRISERAIAYGPLVADYAAEVLTPFGLIDVSDPKRPTALSGGALDEGLGWNGYWSLRVYFLRKETSSWFATWPFIVTDLGYYRANLGEQPFSGGRKPDSVFLHEDDYSPTSLYFNDSTWSGGPPLAFDVLFRFYPDVGMIGELQEGEVAIFQQCGYQGMAAVFAADTPSLAALNDPTLNLDKSAASIKVGPNTGVRLYSQPNYTGANLLIGGDVPCLDATPIGLGTASSLQVRPLSPELIVSASSCEYCQLQGLDLSQTSLANADLAYADLTASRLDGTDFTMAKLDQATLNAASGQATDFSGASLFLASLRNSSFREGRFYGASLVKADLEGADLGGAFFTNCNAPGCSPRIEASAKLGQAHLKNVNLAKADLSGASLDSASLYSSSLVGSNGCAFAIQGDCASASGATFNSTDFTHAYLAGVDFTTASFQGAQLNGAILIASNFSGGSFTVDSSTGAASSLSNAYLQGAQLGEAEMTGTSLEGAFVDFLPQGNLMYIELPERYGAFRNWHAPGKTICVMIAYGTPTTVCPPAGTSPCPGTDPTLTCPNGQSNLAGGCGPANPDGSNPNWNNGDPLASPPGSYMLNATYTRAAAPVCAEPDFAW